MEPQNDDIVNPFGDVLDPQLLLNFATVTAIDMESAIQWWNENASEEWIGVLEAPFFGDL